MPTIIQSMLISIMGIMRCKSAMGHTDHIEMMEYLNNYPNLKEIPEHEVRYIAFKLSPSSDSIYNQHSMLLKALDDPIQTLPANSNIAKQMAEYKKHPWTASFEDLKVMSEQILEQVRQQ